MNVVGVVILFIIWWWLAFLAVLPRNVESRWEAADDGVEGADPGAPTDPQLRRKAWLATKAAAFLTAVSAAIALTGVIDFRS